MSAIAAARTQRAARIQSFASADLIAITGLALLVFFLTAMTWNAWGDIGSDTGYDLVAGARVAHGQLPYVDFIYYYGPLGPFLLGLAAWLGGGGIAPAIGVGLVLATAIVAATYALGRLLAGPSAAFLAAAITAPLAFGTSNYSYVMPHSESATLAILGCLCFLIGLAQFARSESLRWLVVAGAAAGMTALTRPEFELAVIAGSVVWLAVRRRRKLPMLHQAFALAGPALGIPLVVYGAFLARISFHRLVYENLYPVDTLRSGGRTILRAHAPLTASSFASLGAKLALYAAGCVLLVFVAGRLDRNSRLGRVLAGGLLVGGVALVAVAAAKPETVRYYLKFAYGWIPAGIGVAAAILLFLAWRRDRPSKALAQVELAGAALLAVLAVKTYADFLLYSHIPQLAIYAAPFAALFLVRLHLGYLARFRNAATLGAAWLAALALIGIGLMVKDARAESASVRGPGGVLKATPEDAGLFQPAVRWLDAHTRPGEPVLLAPQLTSLYAIADRTDPLPEISLIPGALPKPADERAAITRLERLRVRAVITDERSFAEYGQTSFGVSFDRLVAHWIDRHFVRAGTLVGPGSSHKLVIWMRRGT
jgi:hypothetical protein